MLPPETPAARPPEAAAPPAARCDNCGATLRGTYCAVCGQRAEPLRQPLGRFLQNAFVEFFGVDGRLWPSLGLLLFKPGRLTRAYVQGHRVRYLRPLRLYLSASILFFFLLSVIDPAAQVDLGAGDTPADTTARAAVYYATLDSLRTTAAARLTRQVALVDSLERRYQADSAAFAADRPTLAADTTLARTLEARAEALADLRDDRDDEREDLARLRRRVAREDRRWAWMQDQIAGAPPDSLVHPVDIGRAADLIFARSPGTRVEINIPDWVPQSDAVRRMRAARSGEELQSALGAFIRDALRRLPTVMFVLLPIFAFLMKLLYIRRDWYYSEHLVFGLHTHAFAFVVFTLSMLLVWGSGGAGWANQASNVLVALLPLYFFVAQKHVYRQGWIKTAVKMMVLGWLYVGVLSLGLVVVLLLAAAL